MDSTGINLVEALFLATAVVVSIPFVIFIKWILKELKKEHPEAE